MIRRLFARLRRLWLDGTGDCARNDDMLRAYRFTRALTERLGLAEDPQVKREFEQMERESRALRRERHRR